MFGQLFEQVLSRCPGCLVFWWFGCLVVWLFGGLVFWWFGGLCVWFLVVWLFGFLVFWWFGGLVVWWFGCLVLLLDRHDNSVVGQARQIHRLVELAGNLAAGGADARHKIGAVLVRANVDANTVLVLADIVEPKPVFATLHSRIVFRHVLESRGNVLQRKGSVK